MPRKAFDTLSEPMFYVLMALRRSTLCGVEIAEWIGTKTNRRVSLGPGTLYTILAKLTEEDMIREKSVEGRRRSYLLTDKGEAMLTEEYKRLCTLTADYRAALGEEERP